jgi:hypothetical protein
MLYVHLQNAICENVSNSIWFLKEPNKKVLNGNCNEHHQHTQNTKYVSMPIRGIDNSRIGNLLQMSSNFAERKR